MKVNKAQLCSAGKKWLYVALLISHSMCFSQSLIYQYVLCNEIEMIVFFSWTVRHSTHTYLVGHRRVSNGRWICSKYSLWILRHSIQLLMNQNRIISWQSTEQFEKLFLKYLILEIVPVSGVRGFVQLVIFSRTMYEWLSISHTA